MRHAHGAVKRTRSETSPATGSLQLIMEKEHGNDRGHNQHVRNGNCRLPTSRKSGSAEAAIGNHTCTVVANAADLVVAVRFSAMGCGNVVQRFA